MHVTAGQLFASRYRIVDRIGEGGMGVVFRAFDEQLRRTTALKVLPHDSTRDPDRLSRFRNEARTLSALNHPHIVTIYEVGQDDDAPFIVMEFVEGQTLRARLRDGPLPTEEALEVVSQIAKGLAAAHEIGLVHRDIKPENVMIRRDGYVKILDFGVALLAARGARSPALTAQSIETVPGGAIGTPAYMAPEQVAGGVVDARADLFSLGLVLCETLVGANPFVRRSVLETLAAIGKTPAPAERALATVPADLRTIVLRSLARRPEDRYASANELVSDLRAASRSREQPSDARSRQRRPAWLWRGALGALVLIVAIAGGRWYQQSSRRNWVHERALPEIARLVASSHNAEAFRLILQAEQYLPDDRELAAAARSATRTISIRSTPSGAAVDVQDYASPGSPWLRIGTTPLEKTRVPEGVLRWKVSKAGVGESIVAPMPRDQMSFDLERVAAAPAGMVPVEAHTWAGMPAFFGFLGPFALPAYDIDRDEVTNRQYQTFVDAGGYSNRAYWTDAFADGPRTLTWDEAIARFRDTTGRAGPATWTGGHFPEGKADWPVVGVSWYEAEAYARFVDHALPVTAQVYQAEPAEADKFVVPLSNLSDTLAPVGQHKGLGQYGTYDLVGNAREWTWNGDGAGHQYALGRLPASYGPEALSPFDRSALNGFRTVFNRGPVPPAARAPRPQLHRDFSRVRPADDAVFRIYRNMYAYDRGPLDAAVESTQSSTPDWSREKVSFRTAYGNGRMAAYLFVPRRARPPFQTVVFFPSARVNFLPPSAELGDLSFVDYVVQSGRAVMYPIYESMYERRGEEPTVPGRTVQRQLMIDWSKDLGRSIDYLETRSDIDRDRIGYLGVSQGTAYGVILAALEDRLKVAVFLDGGFFQFEDPIAGVDQVDFAARLRKPVLMVNGRFDETFPYESSQRPMFDLIATPPEMKRHVVFDTPHDVRLQRADLVREVLNWLDTYLGRVR